MARKRTGSGYGLPEEEIQIRIGSPGRGVEHVDRSKRLLVDPAIRCDPGSLRLRDHSTNFAGYAAAVAGPNPLLRIFETNSRLLQIQHTAVFKIHGRSDLV